MRVVRHWDMLPRDDVDFSLWDVSKDRVDRALSNLI